MSRRRFAVSAAVLTAAGMAVAMVATASPGTAAEGGDQLSKQDRARVVAARATGAATVTVLVGTENGKIATAATGLAGLGAEVRYRDDDLGYLRAVVPTDRVDRIPALAGVQTVELDDVVEVPDPRPDADEAPQPQPAPGAGTPAANPYMPVNEIGATAFTAAHPSFDGRGVTVGVVDLGIDPAHPALQRTTTGERKIVDWITATDPADTSDLRDPTWVAMGTVVSGPTFTAGGRTYTAPAAASYRFGTFNERDEKLGGEVGNDVNRDGNPSGSSGLFGVLWDGDATVWVDTDQDGSFADQSPMRNYRVAGDVGSFGADNPATAVAEEMAFVVQVDGRNKYVNIGIVSGAHGTHVAGIVAANGLFGGAMRGAAPGAKLVSVRACLFVTGCSNHAMIEGMIYAVKQAGVDVINMSIGGLPALNDGNNTRALLYNRLIDQYGVQMFFSAGNSGPGLNTVGDPSVATNVMSVGTYISDDTWLSNYGSVSPVAESQHPFSSRGPREDGGFKPNIIAPGAAISSAPVWQAGAPVGGTYPLPPGYAMMNGTSMASPQAAGAGALLVSAARQQGFQSQPAQLRQALMSSARFIKGQGAFEQGAGLIDVPAAYDLLKTNIKTVGISASVPVNTALSGFLATPGRGVGIYDREGVTLGSPYTRTYTLTRTTGGSKAVTYNLSWVGNDGTFATAGSVTLPLNKAVQLPVTITPSGLDAHSAVLRFDDPATAGVDFQTMNVVIVARSFQAADNYSITLSDPEGVGRNQEKRYFFTVPPGTPAFKVDFSGPSTTAGTGQARFLRFHPYGTGVDSNASTSCYLPPATGGSCAGSPNSRTTGNPTAGVWEVTVEARRTSDALYTPYTLTASILGATVTPNPDVIESAPRDVPVARSYTLTNTLGSFTGRAAGTTLGSARRGTFTIADHQVQQYDTTVAAGSTSFRATIGSPSDPAADLDLFVYNCSSGTCVLAGQNADGDSEESVTIANPAAGLWRVIVDGFAVPAGSTTYSYVDVFTNASLGNVAVTDANALRGPGASWTVPGAVTAKVVPATGRVLLGGVEVRTDTNVLIGRGDVVVTNVVG